jgi:hypothetical protein
MTSEPMLYDSAEIRLAFWLWRSTVDNIQAKSRCDIQLVTQKSFDVKKVACAKARWTDVCKGFNLTGSANLVKLIYSITDC